MSESEKQRMWRIAGRYSGIGIEIAVGFGVAVVGGSWLDDKFSTDPYFTLFGVVVGIGVACKTIYRVIAQFRRDQKNSPIQNAQVRESPEE